MSPGCLGCGCPRLGGAGAAMGPAGAAGAWPGSGCPLAPRSLPPARGSAVALSSPRGAGIPPQTRLRRALGAALPGPARCRFARGAGPGGGMPGARGDAEAGVSPRDGGSDVKAKYGFFLFFFLIIVFTVTKRPALMIFTVCSLTSLGLWTSARCPEGHS